MSPISLPEPIERIVPAALLQLSDRPGSALWNRLESLRSRAAGLIPVGGGRFLALPQAADPAVFDRAVKFGEEILKQAAAAGAAGEIRLLIIPAAARIAASSRSAEREGGWSAPVVSLVDEPLIADLALHPPKLEPGRLFLTTHAALHLEGPFRSDVSGTLHLSGGRQIPIAEVRQQPIPAPRVRNAEILSRSLKWVPRPELEAAFTRHLAQPLVRIEGPLGVGKSRLVWERLRSAGEPALFRDASSPYLRPLERELVDRPDRPLCLVYDHLDMAPPAIWAEIEELLKHPQLGRELKLLAVSRPGIAWPKELLAIAPLRVEPLSGESWDSFTIQLFRGLSLPDAVAADLASGVAGNPFALEEALLSLVRDRKLRQVFGSFFFSGTETGSAEATRLQPSRRFIAHVEAELLRLGSPLPLRLLTQSESPVPASELASAVLALGGDRPPTGWSRVYVESGLLSDAEGAWGEGSALASRVIRAAIAQTLPERTATSLREVLGELLAARASSAEEQWAAYRLLAGTEPGARTLLAAAAGASRLPREALFTALRQELASLQERKPSADSAEIEIELLWLLLPLARRMGRLHELRAALERGFDLARDKPQRFLAIAALRADLAQMAGRYAEAETVLRQALAAAREGDNRRKELLLAELGRVLVRQGKTGEARDLFTRMLQVAERRGRKGLATNCRFFLGNIAFHEFELQEAIAHHERALAERREQRAGGVATSLTALGAVTLALGDASRSLAYFEEARELLAAEQADDEEAFALVGVGRALTRLGDVAGASPMLRKALALREKRDDAVGEAIARLAVAENFLHLDQPDTALVEARKAHFVLSLQPESEALADADQLLGRIQSRLRRHELALAHLEEAARLHASLGKRASELADLSYRIAAELAHAKPEAVRAAYQGLLAARARLPRAPSAELHEYHLFLAADWLESRGGRPSGAPGPLGHLERAYEELMRQTAYLDRSIRQRFLFEMPLHRAIVEAATRHDLSLPAV